MKVLGPAYRVLLRAYPPEFRQRFGRAMEQALGDRYRAATARGAGAVATVLVGVNVLGAGSGGASPAAAAVLQEAAARAIETTDPVLAPGQFLMVTTSEVSLVSSDTAASYLVLHRDRLYIPADTSDEWVWDRPVPELYETFSPASTLPSSRPW